MLAPLPESHEAQLKRIFKLDETEQLPERVVELYDELRRTMRVFGSAVTEHQLVLIPFVFNRIPREEVATFIEDIQAGSVSRGDTVVVKWKKKWQFAQYIGYEAKTKQIIVVVDDGHSEERKIAAHEVRLPTEAEVEVLTKV